MCEVYYRIFQLDDDKLTVVCMQEFDECDYDQDRFMTEGGVRNYKLFFRDEEDAIKWLNENVKEEYVDSKYKKLKYNREKFLL